LLVLRFLWHAPTPTGLYRVRAPLCQIRKEFDTQVEHFWWRSKMNGERYIGVALDYSTSSRYALKWAIDNCVRPNDHLIVLVVNKDPLLEGGQAALWEASGTPFIPLEVAMDPHNQQKYQLKLDEELTKTLQEATAKKIVVVFKVYWGDPKEKLCSAAVDAPLDFLVMGCRGLSAIKRTILGSVSNYVANNVPCPVTIVKLPPNL
jgi:nucleotide-binding universal stress UspA family protein